MTNLGNENLCADEGQARKRAQAIKARMAELGHTIPLTHAYEALATSCGFRNWPTMKAQLQSGVVIPNENVGNIRTLLEELVVHFRGPAETGNELHRQRGGKVDLLCAPPGKGKTTLACALNFRTMLTAKATGSEIPYTMIVDIGPSSEGFFETVKSILPESQQNDAVYYKLGHDSTLKINPFDLPLGFRSPSNMRLASLVNFISCLIQGDGDQRQSTKERDFIEATISELYQSFSDAERRFDPATDNTLTRGVHKFRVFNALAYKGSWWDVVDKLTDGGCFDLAELAQRYALPTLSDYIAYLGSDTMESRLDPVGLHRMRSMLRRQDTENSMLGGPTTLGAPATRGLIDPKIVVFDIGSEFGRRRDVGHGRAAFMIARMAITRDIYIREPDLVGLSDCYAAYHKRLLKKRATEGVNVIYEEMHRLQNGQENLGEHLLRELINEMHAVRIEKFALRISSQTFSTFDGVMAESADRMFLLGISHGEKKALTNAYKVDERQVDFYQTELVGPQSDALKFVIFSKYGQSPPSEMRLMHNGIALWSITSDTFDASVRSKLAKIVGYSPAVMRLAERFPNMGVGRYVEAQARQQARNTDEHSYRDLINPITESLVAELAALA